MTSTHLQKELDKIDELQRYHLEGVFDSHSGPCFPEDPSQIAQDLRTCEKLDSYAKNH